MLQSKYNEQRFPTIHDKPRNNYRHKSAKSTLSANMVWYLNSRATDHVTSEIDNLQVKDQTPTKKGVVVVDSKYLSVPNSRETNFDCGSDSFI